MDRRLAYVYLWCSHVSGAGMVRGSGVVPAGGGKAGLCICLWRSHVSGTGPGMVRRAGGVPAGGGKAGSDTGGLRCDVIFYVKMTVQQVAGRG